MTKNKHLNIFIHSLLMALVAYIVYLIGIGHLRHFFMFFISDFFPFYFFSNMFCLIFSNHYEK